MNEYSFEPQKKKIHAGILMGVVGAVTMAGIHLFFLLIFREVVVGDWVALAIQLLVYFFISQAAAQRHYDSQERSPEALRGVRGAGVGAAITTSLLTWVFIVLRDIILDALGQDLSLEILLTFCIVVVDVLLAIAIGSWGGTIVERKYKNSEGY
jgi:hypothetical protein